MSPRLSCFSCEHYRRDGCVHGLEGWPEAGEGCARFQYEPGADEHKTCPMWQADATKLIQSGKAAEVAELLRQVPPEMRDRVRAHAESEYRRQAWRRKTTQSIRRHYDRKSAEGRK